MKVVQESDPLAEIFVAIIITRYIYLYSLVDSSTVLRKNLASAKNSENWV